MDLGFDPEIEPTESDLEEEAYEEPDMMVRTLNIGTTSLR